VVGLIATVRRPGFHRVNLLAATTIERIGVGICVGVAALGLFGFGETIIQRSISLTPLAGLFTLMIFLLAAPGFLWRTRWRGAGEGVATIAVSVAAILSGFSMGFMLVPLVILMMVICIQALLREETTRKPGHPSDGARVK